jgi:hypothetical protein
MKKPIYTLTLRTTEMDILEYLLSRHIDEGSYFGRKEHHYKMCKDLRNKMMDSQQLLNSEKK